MISNPRSNRARRALRHFSHGHHPVGRNDGIVIGFRLAALQKFSLGIGLD